MTNSSELRGAVEQPTALRHDEHCLTDLKRLLADVESVPGFTEGYMYELRPAAGQYVGVLQFLLESCKRLPLHNEVGKTIFMREDAAEMIGCIISYLQEQVNSVKTRGVWDAQIEPPLYDKTKWGLLRQLFKNEIYPSMNRAGVCYSVDFSVKNDRYVGRLVIERFLVDYTDNATTKGVKRDGKFEISLCEDQNYLGVIQTEFDTSMVQAPHDEK